MRIGKVVYSAYYETPVTKQLDATGITDFPLRGMFVIYSTEHNMILIRNLLLIFIKKII